LRVATQTHCHPEACAQAAPISGRKVLIDDPGGIHETGPLAGTFGFTSLDVRRVWQEAGGRVDSACTLAKVGGNVLPHSIIAPPPSLSRGWVTRRFRYRLQAFLRGQVPTGLHERPDVIPQTASCKKRLDHGPLNRYPRRRGGAPGTRRRHGAGVRSMPGGDHRRPSNGIILEVEVPHRFKRVEVAAVEDDRLAQPPVDFLKSG